MICDMYAKLLLVISLVDQLDFLIVMVTRHQRLLVRAHQGGHQRRRGVAVGRRGPRKQLLPCALAGQAWVQLRRRVVGRAQRLRRRGRQEHGGDVPTCRRLGRHTAQEDPLEPPRARGKGKSP